MSLGGKCKSFAFTEKKMTSSSVNVVNGHARSLQKMILKLVDVIRSLQTSEKSQHR
jgi:hypothetical protein